MLVSQDLKFQSYLYGIEMIDAEDLKGKGKVSIVPLWN